MSRVREERGVLAASAKGLREADTVCTDFVQTAIDDSSAASVKGRSGGKAGGEEGEGESGDGNSHLVDALVLGFSVGHGTAM